MKKRTKRKIKKQAIFNAISIIFVLTVGIYYIGRLIYAYIDSNKKIVLSNELAQRIIDQNDTYELHSTFIKSNNIYRFIGDADTNYLRYKGYLWRIIRINKDNSVTMITEDSISSLAYGKSLETNILPWLNKKEGTIGLFENSLENANLVPTKICIDTFKDIEVSGCFETNNDYNIGLLSIDDYLKAGSNNSYLNNNSSFWTSNSYDNEKAWYIANDGLISNDLINSKYGIRPIITLKGNEKVYAGNGTSESPYLIEKKEYQTLNDTYIGQYLTYNNTLWKIVSKEKDKIKIVSDTCLLDKDNKCLEMSFSQYTNAFNTSRKELLYYLNNTYYNTIDHKEYIVSGPFYSGHFSLTNNDYLPITKSQVNFKVGMLSAADLFAYEVPNTFLLTSDGANDLNIFSVNENKALYESIITQELNIRPALYLKSDIKINNGDGSYLAPFEIGDVNNEKEEK